MTPAELDRFNRGNMLMGIIKELRDQRSDIIHSIDFEITLPILIRKNMNNPVVIISENDVTSKTLTIPKADENINNTIKRELVIFYDILITIFEYKFKEL